MKRLLVVEDEDAIREVFEMALRAAGYEVHGKRTAAAALECTKLRRFDLVLTDFKLGREGNGVAVADAAAARGAKAIIVNGLLIRDSGRGSCAAPSAGQASPAQECDRGGI